MFVFLAGALAFSLHSPNALAKDPFANFGNTGLDRKPGASTPSPFQRNAPAAPVVAPGGTAGIALSKEWAGNVAQSAGGQSMKIDDIRKLLAGYGTAEADLASHPEVTIYEGPSAAGGSCRIAYLMPLANAERLLGLRLGTGGRAVVPGFPDGLFLKTYDVKLGIYNRLTLLLDSANQVVALQLKAENVNWYPPSPPFSKQPGDWHVVDYLNVVNKGQPRLAIDTSVNDLRSKGGYLVINTTGGPRPADGIVLKPAANSPKQNATLYLPVPLVKLILFCVERQAAK